MCRPRSAPTRPRLCRDAGSSVGASSAGCWAGWCAGAAGTCARASGRSSGAAAGQGALRVRADRGRRATARGSWGYAPRGAAGQCGLAPPSHASPGDGAPRGRHRVGTKHTRWWRLQGVHGQCRLAPPRTHSPRTGHPGVVTGSGLSTHGELRPRGVRRHGQRAGGGACQASGERAGAGRHGAACACAADNGVDTHAACLLYSKDVDTPVRS